MPTADVLTVVFRDALLVHPFGNLEIADHHRPGALGDVSCITHVIEMPVGDENKISGYVLGGCW